MAKDKITDYDSVASNNLDVGGISVAEGMLPSGVNNAMRELMSHQKEAFGSGTPLYVDQVNNRVGINQAAPAHPVHVGTDDLIVDASGNVGIGGSPTENFEVFGGATNGTAKIGQLIFKNSSGNYAAATDGVHIFPFSDGNTYINNFDGGFVFRTGANVEKMRILSTGGITFNGETAQAHALDDYEEGTWTPASGGGTGPTGSGSYIKIGRSVTVMADVTFTGVTSPTYQITGLPFQANDVQAGACIAWNNSSRYLSLLAPPTTSVLNVYDQQGSTQTISNNNRIIFSVTYQS